MHYPRKKPIILLLAFALITIPIGLGPSEGTERSPLPSSSTPIRSNEAHLRYREFCKQCHMPYPPEFLPAASWEKLLKDPKDHFGEVLLLDPESRTWLVEYLTAHSAERSDSKKARKILEGLGGQTPLRLTETPYIRNKHAKIPPETMKKPAVGSLSNCQACHQRAGEGVLDSKVTIPE